jgi:DNA-binding CsgD family transcriptional regulator
VGRVADAAASRQLVGRALESARIDQLLLPEAEACLVVRGEPGIGKTALLQETCRRARSRGLAVVDVAGVEAETSIAYAGLHQLLGPYLSEAKGLTLQQQSALDGAFGGSAPDRPPSVMELGIVMLELLSVVASRTPLVLAIDDGQWFDLPSIQVCLFVARRLRGPRTKLLVTIRDGEASAFDPAGLPEMVLEPLDAAEALMLLNVRHPTLGKAAQRLVLDTAEGNPLALEELPRCLRVEGVDAAYLRAGAALPINRRLERLYAPRIASLSDVERDELLVGALDGLRAARVNDSRGYRLRHVESAVKSGLVDVDPRTGLARFRHPLVRSGLVQMATVNARRRAHQRLAEHYVGDVERRAEHLAAAAVDPDETIAGLLEEAAASATRRGGAGAAVFWLTRSAELSETSHQRVRRLAEASFLAGQAGLLAESGALLEDADRSVGIADTPESVLSTALLSLYREGDVTGSHRRVAAMITVHRDDIDDATFDRLVRLLLVLAQFAADPEIWQATDEIVDEHGSRLSAATHLYRDCWGHLGRRGGDLPDRLAAAFADLAEGAPWDGMRLAVCAYYVDALSDYRPFLDRMVAQERDRGAITPVMTMLQLIMLDDLSGGAWDRAEQAGERGLALTLAHGYELFAHQFRATLGVLAAQRGDAARADELRKTVERWGRPRRIGHLTQDADVIGLRSALSTGDYEAAWTCATAITTPGTFPPYSSRAPRTLIDLVDAAVHTGHHTEGRLHLDAAVSAGLADISPRLSLHVAGARALLAEGPETEPLYVAALAHPAGPHFPFETARLTLAYGMWLRRHHRVSDARPVLAAAAHAFSGMGATSWVQRARGELATTGSTRARPEDRLDDLTAQEKVVAELAATGLTNKQIGARLSLSTRTVSVHLYRVFPKLGITTRAALRDVLAEGTRQS